MVFDKLEKNKKNIFGEIIQLKSYVVENSVVYRLFRKIFFLKNIKVEFFEKHNLLIAMFRITKTLYLKR
jgi:hypothetical protein